jgi:hypothetical protein
MMILPRIGLHPVTSVKLGAMTLALGTCLASHLTIQNAVEILVLLRQTLPCWEAHKGMKELGMSKSGILSKAK